MIKNEALLLKSVQLQIDAVKAVADQLPGVVIIHRLPEFKIAYMSARGLKELKVSMKELQQIGPQEYHQRFFNPEDADDYVPKMLDFVAQNGNESISFFQQVRVGANGRFVWHLSTSKILMRDSDKQPVLMITTAYPLESMRHLDNKVERLLEENIFLRKNYDLFSKLSKQERVILRLTVLGNSSSEIAAQLFISVATVETHRKHIRRKLNANSSFELSQYARAFDLI